MGCDSCRRCYVCHGMGPLPAFIWDDERGLIPQPFIPCPGCGLEWPTQPFAVFLPPPTPSAPVLSLSPEEGWQPVHFTVGDFSLAVLPEALVAA